MAVSPAIVDWPSGVVAPSGQLFLAPREYRDGGFTSGAAVVGSVQPGGRARMVLSFSHLKESGMKQASWLASAIYGSVFRIPLWQSYDQRGRGANVQLVTAADLGLSPAPGVEKGGIPWSNGQPWSSGNNWLWHPATVASAAALKGEEVFTLDLSSMNGALQHGEVIGHRTVGYKVMDIRHASNGVATITVSPPLRKALGLNDLVTFRPKGLFRCTNPDAFVQPFRMGRWHQPGQLEFVEVIL